MASQVTGFEYDIFISYRQNDNKYDGWVSEFIANLNKELEATIKDKLNVYFDTNPHDGILETHSVNLTLENKLKCIIFIPILSRTFCDPKSFAWNNEFLSFLNAAKNDSLGLEVKLISGNVASRVLPVRIHELEPDDVRLLETHLSNIRSVDFIYKSPGVNRPLRANEDHPHDNLNKTYYRDQINKVANAIDEIIHSVVTQQASKGVVVEKKPVPKPDALSPENELQPEDKTVRKEPKPVFPDEIPKIRNKGKSKIFSISSIGVILAVIALFLFSSGTTLPFSKRDWVLITDFENLTDNPVFDKSLNTAFSITASQSRYVNVFPRSRMAETLTLMKVKDRTTIDDKTGREIAVREGINLYIVPGISEIGKKYVISAKIIEAKTGNLLRSEILYAEREDEILSVLDKLSKRIRRQLGESRYEISTQDKPLSKVTTSSLDALKQYSLGIERHVMLDFAGARNYYKNALRIDTGFIAAKASLGTILIEKFDSVESGRKLLNSAIKSVDNLTEREKLGILAFHSQYVMKDLSKAIEYSRMRVDLYPDDNAAHNNLGWYYQNSGNLEEALKEYKEAIRINPKMAMTYSGIVWIYLDKTGQPDSALIWAEKMISDNPQNAWAYCYLGAAWICLDSLNKAEAAFLNAREINPNFILNLYRLAHTYRLQGRYNKAADILKRILEIDKTEASALYDLGINYQSLGNRVESKKYFTSFKKIATEDWVRMWPGAAETYISISAVAARLGDMDTSEKMYKKAFEIDSTNYERLTEVLCIQGNTNEALDQIGKAFETGYRDLFWLKLSPDLQLLQTEPRYRVLMKKYFL
jgi:tetratricopeptide (TPR) repeat protein